MPASNPNSSIVLVVDGLRASSLGPYGNTWFDTPSFNRLASQSLLFEQCISDCPTDQLGVARILKGQHACVPGDHGQYIMDSIGAAETESILITSDASNIPECRDCFDAVLEVDLPQPDEPAADFAGTGLATYFAAAIDVIQKQQDPCMMFLDCPGIANHWDAPYEFRLRLADEDDPEPSMLAMAQELQFDENIDDPDLLLDFQMVYGGQVSLLDELLAILLDQIENVAWAREALFGLTSTRGFPLGEHGVVGYYRPILNSELLQVPLMVRYPAAAGMKKAGMRSLQLVQPGSIYNVLHNWHLGEVDAAGTYPLIHDRQVFPNERESALISKFDFDEAVHYAMQTRCWKLIKTAASRLYVKPDDCWEFNNVSQLCPRVAEELEQELDKALESLAAGTQPQFDLSDVLAFGVE